MDLVTTSQVFLVGFLGGILLELIHWYNLRREDNFPEYIRSPFYWGVSMLMAAAGGFLAVLYFGSRAQGMIVLHVGLSAPLIIQKLTTTIATVPGGRGARASILNFFRW